MLTKRFSMIAAAAVFAASSSFAMLQSARPALADADDHHPRVHQRVAGDHDHDRDDRRGHAGQQSYNRNSNHGTTWNHNGNTGNTWNHNGNTNPGKHKGWKHKKSHDRDHDGDRR